MYTLFVGDNTPYLSTIALEYNCNAALLDLASYNNNKHLTGVYYTSLADIVELDIFLDICVNATEIFYYPSEQWTDPSLKSQQWTESVLYYCNQFVKVNGLLPAVPKYFKNSQKKERKSNNKQLWVAGCSITAGSGVEHTQTWKYCVSNALGLAYTDLSRSGSSISWSADQLLRSDIKDGDIVFWQLTCHERNFAVHETTNEVYHLLPSKFENTEYSKLFPIEYIDSKTNIYKNILAIQQVYNFCKKINAKLIILGTMYDWDNNYIQYGVPNFEQMLIWPMEFVDKGNDNLHPGPKQHKLYAKKFIELLEKYRE